MEEEERGNWRRQSKRSSKRGSKKRGSKRRSKVGARNSVRRSFQVHAHFEIPESMGRHRFVIAAVVLAVVVFSGVAGVAVASRDEEFDEDGRRRGGSGVGVILVSLVKNLLLGFLTASIGFFITFPFEFIRRSSEYQRRSRGHNFAPAAFFQSLPTVAPQLLHSNHAKEFAMQSYLMFAPRVIVKFASYGLVRGSGKTNLVLVVLGSLVSGVVTMLYAFPFRKVELDNAINTGRYQDLVKHLRRKASKEGIQALYHGISAAIPFMIVYNLILFTAVELISSALKQNIALVFAVASPVAVVAASVLAAPLEQLRRTFVQYPLDYEEIFMDRGKPRVPDFTRLADYFKYIYRKWTEAGVAKMFGRVHIRVNTFSLMLATGLHHVLVNA